MNPRAPRPCVLGHLADLGDVAELVRFAELTLADRARVRVEDRHQPVRDRLARDPQLDLLAHPLGAVCHLLELLDRGDL